MTTTAIMMIIKLILIPEEREEKRRGTFNSHEHRVSYRRFLNSFSCLSLSSLSLPSLIFSFLPILSSSFLSLLLSCLLSMMVVNLGKICSFWYTREWVSWFWERSFFSSCFSFILTRKVSRSTKIPLCLLITRHEEVSWCPLMNIGSRL